MSILYAAVLVADAKIGNVATDVSYTWMRMAELYLCWFCRCRQRDFVGYA